MSTSKQKDVKKDSKKTKSRKAYKSPSLKKMQKLSVVTGIQAVTGNAVG
ncbi:MAG: hypothetical protein RLY14_960 [Planctomycetota bacterium]|jgi:hypothetical protein